MYISVTTSSSKPVFVDHQHAEDSAISSIRVHVEDHDSQDNIDEQLLTPGEQGLIYCIEFEYKLVCIFLFNFRTKKGI